MNGALRGEDGYPGPLSVLARSLVEAIVLKGAHDSPTLFQVWQE